MWISGHNIFDQSAPINARPPTEYGEELTSQHPGGVNTLFADGSVHFLKNQTNPVPLAALCTRRSARCSAATRTELTPEPFTNPEESSMMRRIVSTLALALGMASTALADQVITFEDLGLPPHSFNNNAGSGGQFVVNGTQFNNSFDPTYGVWSGWSISSMTDTTTPGYTNQYSAIAGSGADNSQTYAVGFTFGQNANPFNPAGSYINLAPGTTPESVQVTNTTYDYFSMLDGNQFSRKFGAGDYFLLDVRGYTGADGAGKEVGEVDFYLANFLGSNSDIINTWQTLDLSSLLGAQSLQFGLSSTDNDPVYGMNTPAYFAIDNLVLGATPSPSPPAW